jgi:GNAT superfamily N-acetyltransferase
MPVLEALRVDISVGWWRWGTPPPTSRFVTHCERSVTFGADLTQDYEKHWRSTRHHKDVRSARNRCRGLTLSVDSAGAAEWTTRNWARVWSVSPAEVLDRLLVNKALEGSSRLHTHLLSDGGEPVAGATGTVDGTTFVAGVLYRDPGYESRNVGTALIDHVFRWAAQAGYSSFDLGGGHDYKERWAPEAGERWSFKVCASSLCWARRGLLSLTSSLRSVLGRRPTH